MSDRAFSVTPEDLEQIAANIVATFVAFKVSESLVADSKAVKQLRTLAEEMRAKQRSTDGN